MKILSLENLRDFRANRYRLYPGKKLTCLQDAVDFVKERGFVFFWPIKGVEMPSLWSAVAGDRPVADAHDDPGHVTWSWKDDSLGKRIWYYGKIIRKKATMIDLEVAPYFYALSENYGNPNEDILIQYHEGRLTREAKAVFDYLYDHGPSDTIAIRRGTHMTSRESNSRFDRAITLLQSDFKVLPVGISDSGGWRYAFIYELVHRYYPDILESARHVSENEARDMLLKIYIHSVGASDLRNLMKLFQWEKQQLLQSINRLADVGFIMLDLEHPQVPGEWIGLPEVLEG